MLNRLTERLNVTVTFNDSLGSFIGDWFNNRSIESPRPLGCTTIKARENMIENRMIFDYMFLSHSREFH